MNARMSRAKRSRSTVAANTRSGPSPAYFRLSQLRKMKGRQQVAAVCYRLSDEGIEFLLVETRRRRWTFPKGSAEPGLTHAQAAALEAYEEAGVHGRIEEQPFARYVRSKRPGKKKPNPEELSAQPADKDILIDAHLCEVLRLTEPEEARRNPTWFPAAKAKRRLRQDRSTANGNELARVVDLAVTRISSLHAMPTPKHNAKIIDAPLLAARKLASLPKNVGMRGPQAYAGDGTPLTISSQGVIESRTGPAKDALQRVQFEAGEVSPAHVSAALLRYLSGEAVKGAADKPAAPAVVQALALNAREVPALPASPSQRAQVTTIDQARKPNHRASFKNR